MPYFIFDLRCCLVRYDQDYTFSAVATRKDLYSISLKWIFAKESRSTPSLGVHRIAGNAIKSGERSRESQYSDEYSFEAVSKKSL